MDTTTDTVKFSGQFIGLAMLGSLALFLILFVMSVTGRMDYAHEVNQESRYCYMVERWNSQTGVAPEHRTGWPDYRNAYDEICTGEK
jgi:hypothetical protein